MKDKDPPTTCSLRFPKVLGVPLAEEASTASSAVSCQLMVSTG